MKRKIKVSFIMHSTKIVVFIAVLILGLVFSMLTPLRPTYSESEKRDLTKFPAFTADAFLTGSYFRDIETWFSDTFPMRDSLIGAYSAVEGLYGIKTTTVHGTVEEGDDIPDIPTKPIETIKPSSDSVSSEKSAESSSTAVSKEPEQTGENFGGLLLVGDTAYEYYNFNTSVANRYAAVLNTAAANFGANANVYDIIVPTSIAIKLPDSMKGSVNSSDQEKAIKYMYGSMTDSVKKVDAYSNLMAHRNEYLYFRTDHHWTQLGAYYSYEKFAAAAGFTPIGLSEFDIVINNGFLGSFYTATKKHQNLAANPDQVITYAPRANATLTIQQPMNVNKGPYSWPIVSNTDKSPAYNKYAAAFIGADNPYSVINNHDLSDGSTCVVVKESFGNAFVPLLVKHYQTIHIVDYRYYKGKLSDFVNTQSKCDIVFINNISATRTSARVSELERLVG